MLSPLAAEKMRFGSTRYTSDFHLIEVGGDGAEDERRLGDPN